MEKLGQFGPKLFRCQLLIGVVERGLHVSIKGFHGRPHLHLLVEVLDHAVLHFRLFK